MFFPVIFGILWQIWQWCMPKTLYQKKHFSFGSKMQRLALFIPLSYWTDFTLEDPRTPHSIPCSLQTTAWYERFWGEVFWGQHGTNMARTRSKVYARRPRVRLGWTRDNIPGSLQITHWVGPVWKLPGQTPSA